MRQRSAAFDRVAQELIEKAVAELTSAEQVGSAINGAFQRLERAMSAMVGDVGFRALFARALQITSKEGAATDLPIGPQDASGEGWVGAAERVGAEKARLAATLLLANILELLASFIGEDLTFRLVRRAFQDSGNAGSDGGQEP